METFEIPEELRERLRELGFGFRGVLSPMEVLFLAEEGIAEVLGEQEREELREKYRWEYAIYRDLRKKGYIVRPSPIPHFLRVYRKGYRPEEDRTLYLLRVVLPEEEVGKAQMLEDLAMANAMKKELVYAFVGEELFYVAISRKSFP